MNGATPNTEGHVLAQAGFTASLCVALDGLEVELTIYRANRWMQRLRGLLCRDELAPDEALLLEPCASVHTFGMTRPIDVVFLDAPLHDHARVLDCRPAMATSRIAYAPHARTTLELRAGCAWRLGLVRDACVTARWPSSNAAFLSAERSEVRS